VASFFLAAFDYVWDNAATHNKKDKEREGKKGGEIEYERRNSEERTTEEREKGRAGKRTEREERE